MTSDRYVVLALGTPRAGWLRELTRWAASASVPIELVRCLSLEDVRARLRSGRAWSAVLLDGSVPGLDVDLLAASTVPVLVVDDARRGRDWPAMGAVALDPATLTRQVLLDALEANAVPVGASWTVDEPVLDLRERGAPMVVLLGQGSPGVTTTAAAAAEGLARHHDVVLADLALRAEQAVLHDVRDVAPGVQELVEAHRGGRPTREQVRALTFDDPGRAHHLLLGLRHERYWSTLRPRAVAAAVDSLRRAFGLVVADVTADLDGSTSDLEERNALARTAVAAADLVLVVGRPTTKGIHALVRAIGDLLAAGVAVDRVLPVVTAAPRHPRHRSDLAAVVADLARTTNAPLFLPVRRVDEAWRDALPMPEPLPTLLASAVRHHLHRLGPATPADEEPVLVAPGSLGLA